MRSIPARIQDEFHGVYGPLRSRGVRPATNRRRGLLTVSIESFGNGRNGTPPGERRTGRGLEIDPKGPRPHAGPFGTPGYLDESPVFTAVS